MLSLSDFGLFHHVLGRLDLRADERPAQVVLHRHVTATEQLLTHMREGLLGQVLTVLTGEPAACTQLLHDLGRVEAHPRHRLLSSFVTVSGSPLSRRPGGRWGTRWAGDASRVAPGCRHLEASPGTVPYRNTGTARR